MRTLTIHRKKKIVASIMKVYIYVDEKNAQGLQIDKSVVKGLPTLKNGASTSFEIPNEEVTLYVIFDRNFPQKFHSGIVIGPGESDVELDTYPKYNPLQGNPFIIVPK